MGSLGRGSSIFQLAQGSIFIRLPNRLRWELTWVLQSRQFFYLTIGYLKVEILGIFKKSLTNFELLGSQNWSNFFFWKNRKNDEKFFSLFLFVLCSTSCIVFPRLDIMLEKPFYLSKQSIEIQPWIIMRSNH